MLQMVLLIPYLFLCSFYPLQLKFLPHVIQTRTFPSILHPSHTLVPHTHINTGITRPQQLKVSLNKTLLLLHPNIFCRRHRQSFLLRSTLTLKLLLTYLLTPWSTVLLEKLTGSQLAKKFPAFYGTRRYITAFASARHLSLS